MRSTDLVSESAINQKDTHGDGDKSTRTSQLHMCACKASLTVFHLAQKRDVMGELGIPMNILQRS
jgi:hypothetical protein